MASDLISHDRFIIMQRKLFFGIMTPAALITIICGGILFIHNIAFYKAAVWLHIKLLCIIALVIYHVWCGITWVKFKNRKNTKSHVFYRWMNEVPVVFLIIIIALAVYKPIF